MHLCVKTVDVAASRQEGCVIFEYIVALNMVIITFVITNRPSMVHKVSWPVLLKN